MREFVPAGVDLVRILPNPPIAQGLGMDPVAYDPGVTPEHQEYVEALLSALGETVVVRDDQMNWCVGLSGASLRTLMPVLEGMTAAGIEAGLSPQDARLVAAQVMLGTASLVKHSSLSFEELKALTPMQTVDEPEMKERFLEIARQTNAKVDGTMAKILAV
jgi:pyrroline-5-carboxylate reductase